MQPGRWSWTPGVVATAVVFGGWGCGDDPAGRAEAPSLATITEYDEQMIIPGSSSFLELGFTETIGKPGLAAMVVQVHDGLVETSEPVQLAPDIVFEAPIAIELDDGWLVGAAGATGASVRGRRAPGGRSSSSTSTPTAPMPRRSAPSRSRRRPDTRSTARSGTTRCS